jgi:Uma2 family endonuclease
MTHEIETEKESFENNPLLNSELSPPRVGRRESEPHSYEISYIFDVLSTNFPNDRTFWDLHHYFRIEGEEDERCFDISWFRNFQLPEEQSYYKAWDHNNRIPDLVINVLSHSTWMKDISEIVDFCKEVKIPTYIVYAPYHIANRLYKPPFLRIYQLKDDGHYDYRDCRIAAKTPSNLEINQDALISLGSKYPFLIGLEQLPKKHANGSDRFRLIFVNPNSKSQYLNSLDIKEQKIQDQQIEIQKLKDQLNRNNK